MVMVKHIVHFCTFGRLADSSRALQVGLNKPAGAAVNVLLGKRRSSYVNSFLGVGVVSSLLLDSFVVFLSAKRLLILQRQRLRLSRLLVAAMGMELAEKELQFRTEFAQ